MNVRERRRLHPLLGLTLTALVVGLGFFFWQPRERVWYSSLEDMEGALDAKGYRCVSSLPLKSSDEGTIRTCTMIARGRSELQVSLEVYRSEEWVDYQLRRWDDAQSPPRIVVGKNWLFLVYEGSVELDSVAEALGGEIHSFD